MLQAQGTYQGPVAASLEQSIAWLEQAIATVNEAIQQHIDHHPDLQDQTERLQTVPGIGRRNVLPILVLLHRWGTLTDYQGSTRGLTAFVGLDSQPFQSGRSIRKPSTISRQGDPALRSLLYFSALGGTRGNNPLRHFYQRLVAANKPKKLALIAAARKMLSWAWVDPSLPDWFKDNILSSAIATISQVGERKAIYRAIPREEASTRKSK